MPVALAASTALLLFNGTIRTNTRSLDAVAPSICFDSVVKATGTLDAVAAACPNARRIDLSGATAVPGLTDAHAHIMLEAARRRTADLSTCKDAAACASVLEKWGAAHPLQGWVQGFGFDQTSWPAASGRRGTISMIRRPARADHISGHAVWVNSAALRAANITRATKSPPSGGTIVRDALGRPTGILTDDAMDLIDAVVPPPRASAVDASFQEVLGRMRRRRPDRCPRPGSFARRHRLLLSALRTILTLRLNVYRDAASHEQIPPVGSGESRLVRVRGAKFFCDGAMGSWTAAMLEPYSDRPSSKGHADLQRERPARRRQTVERCGVSGLRPRHWGCGEPPDTRRLREVCCRKGGRSIPRRARPDPIRTGPAAVRQARRHSEHANDALRQRFWGMLMRLGARANLSYAWRAPKDSGVDVLPLGSDFPTAGTIPPCSACTPAFTGERPDGTPKEVGIRKSA